MKEFIFICNSCSSSKQNKGVKNNYLRDKKKKQSDSTLKSCRVVDCRVSRLIKKIKFS